MNKKYFSEILEDNPGQNSHYLSYLIKGCEVYLQSRIGDMIQQLSYNTLSLRDNA